MGMEGGVERGHGQDVIQPEAGHPVEYVGECSAAPDAFN